MIHFALELSANDFRFCGARRIIRCRAALERQIEVERYYDGKRLHYYFIVMP